MLVVEVGYFPKFLTIKDIEIFVAITLACPLMTYLKMSHFYHQCVPIRVLYNRLLVTLPEIQHPQKHHPDLARYFNTQV